MAGKAVGEQKALDALDRTDQRIMVKQVHVIRTGPRPTGANFLECRNPMRQRRPDPLLEQMRINRNIILVHFGIVIARTRTNAADKQLARRIGLAFGAAPRAGGVDQQRHAVERGFAMERVHKALFGDDRNLNACQGRNMASIRPGRIDDKPTANPRTRRQMHVRDPPRLFAKSHHLVTDIVHAQRPRLAAEGLHQRPAVKPAFPAAAPRAANKILDPQPRKLCRQSRLVEPANIRPLLLLHRVILGQNPLARLAGEIEIAAFMQINGGGFAVHLQMPPDVAQKRDPEQRHADIDGA